MISLLEIEAAISAYYQVRGKKFSFGEQELSTELPAMAAALAAAEMARTESLKSSSNR